jgi:predicted DNA-binding transcriptional regulator YafY
MLSDDEALAVLLGLVAGRRTGWATTEQAASETASAKIRRVLPVHLARRLDALLGGLSVTDGPSEFPAPEAAVLLTVADAVRHRRPISIRYADRDGRRSERTLHAYGVVAHAGRWYVTGLDPGLDERRTFRLDRIADARTLTGSFHVPEGLDPAEDVVSGFAAAEYRHEVTLRVQGTVAQVRTQLPATVARIEEAEQESGDERWLRVEIRAERLDWLPPVLAALDRPFVIEHPDELRDLVVALADRLASCARRA